MARQPGIVKPRNLETDAVVKALERVAVGALITHETLAALTKGRDYYNTVNSARKILQKEQGIAFRPEHGNGYVRLSPTESVGHTQRIHGRISRAATKGMRELEEVAWKKGANITQDAAMASAASFNVFLKTRQVNSQKTRDQLRKIADAVPQKDAVSLIDALRSALDMRAKKSKKRSEG